MNVLKNWIIRNIPPAIRDEVVSFRDRFRRFPDKAIVNGKAYTVVPDKFWITFNNGSWEPELKDFFRRHINPEKMVMDIGGYIGPTFLYAQAYQPKKIVLVEADPKNFSTLQQNLQMNALLVPVELRNICISERSGETVSFGPMDKHLPHTATHGIGGNGNFVKTFAFTEFLAGCDLANTNVIKIDIEGGERFLADGLDYLSTHSGIVIYLALHPPFWPERNQTAEKLLNSIQKFDLFDNSENPLSMEELKKRMLSDERTYYRDRRGIFFDIILKS